MKPAEPHAREIFAAALQIIERAQRRTCPDRACAGSLGVLGGTAYTLFNGEYLFHVPRWAALVFYSGFLAGFRAYGWGLSKEAPKVVGVLNVGLACAALAVLARFAWFALKLRRQSAALRHNSE